MLDARDYLATTLMHAVLQPKRISPKIKPTISDTQEDFILLIPTLNQFKEKLDCLQSKFYKQKLNIQPKIIVVGLSFADITECLVYFDGVRYKCTSVRKCIDVVIKLCYVFNLNFSPISKEVWLFFQEYFFNIDSKQSNIKLAIRKLNTNN